MMDNVQIRMQQEKIWELQGHEENVRTELEELKGTPAVTPCPLYITVPVLIYRFQWNSR
jgi:hypothetical protein